MASMSRRSLIVALFCCTGLTGCASVRTVPASAHRYRIEVALDPAAHTLTGRTTMDLSLAIPEPSTQTPDEPTTIAFRLHPGLTVRNVTVAGAVVRSHRNLGPDKDSTSKPTPNRHIVTLDHPAETITLFVTYDGTIHQDVSAGEKAGEIHNFDMTAHVGEEGIYLNGAYWHPQPIEGDDATPLADYTLLASPIDGMALVGGGISNPALSEQTGMLTWQSPFPLTDMVLVGGPHDVHKASHGDVSIALHLKPDQAQFRDGLMQAVRRNLDRYEPLIGKYPTTEYTIVDNFFSSGFAFPTFTLLSSAVINMGERSQTAHGYIDHEMLHSWWGNGIMVDPEDGNWCEALTSYATNYYGHVLDGEEDEARRKRRNYAHFLSRMKPERDRPLGTYGQEDGCSRGVSYSKGAAVFHMLAMTIGQDNFWAAMREFTQKFVGRYASWEDIREVCETHGATTLDTFFKQWIRSSGAPTLEITGATYHSADQVLRLDVSQGDTDFDLNVPVRIIHAAGTTDVNVHINQSTQTVELPMAVVPITVELDPDYHVFRKVPSAAILPTTAATRYGDKFTVVLPSDGSPKTYETLRSIFESSFEENERTAIPAGEQNETALAKRCVLVLGDAVRNPYVAAFLSAVEFPVSWDDDGFQVSGVRYDAPDDGILCTIAHPGVPGGGITVVYGNSESGIPKAMNVPMYEHSLVIFDKTKPTVRLDFEKHTTVTVTPAQ